MSDSLKNTFTEFKEFYHSLSDEEKWACACIDFDFDAYEKSSIYTLEHCQSMFEGTRELVLLFRAKPESVKNRFCSITPVI